jgi:transglycosylase-like protein
VLALLFSASTSTALRPNTHHPDPCHGKEFTAKAFHQFADSVWRLSHWERGEPKGSTIAAERHKLRCAAGPENRRAMKHRWRLDKRAFYRHRHEERERLRYTPYDCGGGVRSAIECSIMWCESGGSYTARNPSSTAGGKYQILDSTWYAYGGARYADSYPAAVAPPAEQDRVAAAIWADVGPSAWACA